MKQSIVIYRGPSMLDGAPIVVIASVGSSNVKTGSMVQTWIMRSDLHPSEASARKADGSICGDCPRRHSLGGDCYVQIFQAPRSVWESWDRQGRPGENWSDPDQILKLTNDARAYGLRLGSYGDPMAVPSHVWQDLIEALAPRSVVGYTHQWHSATLADTWYRENLMASCDDAKHARFARLLGWRFFLAMPATEIAIMGTPDRTIECPATRERNPLTCNTCGICDGSQGKSSRASVYLAEHGMRSASKGKRSIRLGVIS